MDGGSGSLRVNAEETDQLSDATINATAPSLSMGAPPRAKERLISTATPPHPIRSAKVRRTVSFCVLRKMISESAMNAGIVASMTAATPEGTRCSAQKSNP